MDDNWWRWAASKNIYVCIYIYMYSYCWMILPSDQKWSPTVKSCKVWTSILCWPRTTLPAWHGFPECPQHCERCVRQHAMRFSAKVQRGSCWLAVMGTRSILRTTRCHGDDPRRNWGTNHHPKSSWPRGGNYAFWRRHGHAKDTPRTHCSRLPRPGWRSAHETNRPCLRSTKANQLTPVQGTKNIQEQSCLDGVTTALWLRLDKLIEFRGHDHCLFQSLWATRVPCLTTYVVYVIYMHCKRNLDFRCWDVAF